VPATALPALSVQIARIGHRISVARVLALVVGLNLIAWTSGRAGRRRAHSSPTTPLPALALTGAALVLLAAALAPWSDDIQRSLLHAAVGVAVVPIASVVGWRLRAESRRLAVSLALLAAATPLAGIVASLTSSPSASIVHNACSALLGAALAVAAVRPRRDSPS
jgi:hypothetical protein